MNKYLEWKEEEKKKETGKTFVDKSFPRPFQKIVTENPHRNFAGKSELFISTTYKNEIQEATKANWVKNFPNHFKRLELKNT